MLRDALERGARRIVLGIGGSATTDGGAATCAVSGPVGSVRMAVAGSYVAVLSEAPSKAPR